MNDAHELLVYHFTILLAYRPFFLLSAELERRRLRDEIRRSNYVNTAELASACEACIDSARTIILLSESLVSLEIGIYVSFLFTASGLGILSGIVISNCV